MKKPEELVVEGPTSKMMRVHLSPNLADHTPDFVQYIAVDIRLIGARRVDVVMVEHV